MLIMKENAGIVFGFFLGFLGNALIEWFKTPTLEITVGSKTLPRELPRNPSIKYIFLHLNVKNKNFLWFTQPALAVKAKISFKNPSTGKEIFSIDGRWAGNPEPYIPTNPHGTEGTVNPTLYPLLRRIDILSGSTEELDVGIKYDDETSIYAFSNESYEPPEEKMWRKSKWEITLPMILLDVTVYSGTLKTRKRFLLENPSNDLTSVSIKKYKRW